MKTAMIAVLFLLTKQHKLLMTDIDLGQKEAEVNETFRKLFQ